MTGSVEIESQDQKFESFDEVIRVLDVDLKVKYLGSSLFFERDSLLSLLQKAFGLSSKTSFSSFGSNSSKDPLSKPFISARNVISFLKEIVIKVALKNALSGGESFLSLGNQLISYSIHSDGEVYLDILGAFMALGQLQIAMSNKWQSVDAVLTERNIPIASSFSKKRRKDTNCESRFTEIHRSIISYSAFIALVQSPLCGERRETLLKTLSPLDTKMSFILQAKKTLVEAFDKIPRKVFKRPYKVNTPSSLESTEPCLSSCGRKYHFTVRCCSQNHSLILSNKNVRYIVREGVVFLDKCNAFAALGRMYVIRCSDYRKSDKLLASAGISPLIAYIYEKRLSDVSRSPRTHISLEAFNTLVSLGFADSDKGRSLYDSIEKLKGPPSERLKKACLNYKESKDRDFKNSSESFPPSQFSKYHLYDSSSLTIGDTLEVHCRKEHGQLYIDLERISKEFFESSLSHKFLKQQLRSHCKVRYPFFPSLVKRKQGTPFISVNALIKLLKGNWIVPSKCSKEQLLFDLSPHQRDSKRQKPSNNHHFVVVDHENENEEEEDEEEEKENIVQRDEDEDEMDFPFEILKSELGSSQFLTLCDLKIPFEVLQNTLYLHKDSVFNLLNGQTTKCGFSSLTNFRKMDKVLLSCHICLDDAFLYKGRHRSYISLEALRTLVHHDFFSKSFLKDELLNQLYSLSLQTFELAKRTSSLLVLPSFGEIPYKVSDNNLYIHTLTLLKAVGLSSVSNELKPSKAYFSMNKFLASLGLRPSSFFLKIGKSKYVYISLRGLFILFQTEFGPFTKDKFVLLREILQVCRTRKLIMDKKPTACQKASEDKYLRLPRDFGVFRYKIVKNTFYLHSKSVFSALGLDGLISTRGYEPLLSILQGSTSYSKNKFDFLKSKEENYAFISLGALVHILESKDPIMVILETKETFYRALIQTLESSVVSSFPFSKASLSLLNFGSLPLRVHENKMYFLRHRAYQLSGLYDKASISSDNSYDIYEDPLTPLLDRNMAAASESFLSEDGDIYAYISVSALLILLDLDTMGVCSHYSFTWNDVISAISTEVPKLKIQVQMSSFKNALLSELYSSFTTVMRNKIQISSENSLEKRKCDFVDLSKDENDEEEEEATIDEYDVTSESEKEEKHKIQEEEYSSKKKMKVSPSSPSSSSSSFSTSSSSPTFPSYSEVQSTSPQFASLTIDVMSNISEGNMIGDWIVSTLSEKVIVCNIHPGTGASKQMSFLHPDISTFLSYKLILHSDLTFEFFINKRRVPQELLIRFNYHKGILSLLYHLQTLRPCFGSFHPEFVETIGNNNNYLQTDTNINNTMNNNSKNNTNDHNAIFIDREFIGSSQNGRTIGGTVRSLNCNVLSVSDVSDMCSYCSKALSDLVINRSTLKNADLTPSLNSTFQRSVWKIESTNEHCTRFLCPQIQSFNSSLPNVFDRFLQGSLTVQHHVDIKADLSVTVKLNGFEILKNFEDFTKNKIVSSLLDQVASLRFCVGYPDTTLVTQAKYIQENKKFFHKDIQKYFNSLFVDSNFVANMTMNQSELRGTLRHKSCRYVAMEFSDICEQCRLLQEPFEFHDF